jgi:CDGSH-type Zn-finger protein/uncharacterized Fe-S cluster protein YjdI
MDNSSIAIESRMQLLFVLAEAAEIEHNFMCLYLFALFGLKRNEEEGLTAEELKVIDGWRRVMLGVALEEMNHLTLVSNLFVALGATPHLSRPNFPASPGLYPADIITELRKLDLSTLDHFIYLERPLAQELKDGESFVPEMLYSRESPQGRLMPHAGDYKTVGQLYQVIRDSIEKLCTELGEKNLFCGSTAQQIGPVDSPLPGLTLVKDRASALKALDVIITQGEGALEVEGSHFSRFKQIKKEYLELLEKNPKFDPSRPLAPNPVMRKPLIPNRAWVTEPLAARYMDLANAFYIFMLRCLVQIYTIEDRDLYEKRELLEIAYSLMHAMATMGETLTHMPVSTEDSSLNAGMSFAMIRSLAPFPHKTELLIMSERLVQFVKNLKELNDDLRTREKNNVCMAACIKELTEVENQVMQIQERAKKMMARTQTPQPVSTSSSGASSLADVAASSDAKGIEVAESDQIAISFETVKCMHARHCVTQLPSVFLANTPGKWLFPETACPEDLAAVIRQCPSGALQYRSKTESLHDEQAPAVNILRVRENGPLAFLADLEIDDSKAGFRATLCRCGKSKNKPYCDSSHVGENFRSPGEPETIDATALTNRGGVLKINRLPDGPLQISGNLELCSGTGRVVLRTDNVRLCRCGNSQSKPVCDGSHIAAGFRDKITPKPKSPGESAQQSTYHSR